MSDSTTSVEGSDRPPWHASSAADVLDRLGTDAEGLSPAIVEERLVEYGPNEIQDEDGIDPLHIFIGQFRDVLIYILIAAAVLSLGIGLLPGYEPNVTDAVLILLILLANGVFGFVQDYQAERSIEALKELSAPKATVVREGRIAEIASIEVVPGDVVVLEGGDAIPADARLIESSGLEVNESALTGESAPVTKAPDPVAADAPLAERSNMVYMNTTVASGRGRAVVVNTGMATEVGAIATQLQSVEEEPTRFQEEMDQLGTRIGYGVVGLIGLIVAVQFLLTAASPLSIILVGVTLAVAAVPEGLPAVVTLTLALGSRRLVARNALVRRLSVVESLGSVDVILTDKTGTLTENRMTVTRLLADGREYEVTGAGADGDGGFQSDEGSADPAAIEALLRCGAACNNAEAAPADADRDHFGDPTEVALLVAARKAGIEPSFTRRREFPFTSERQRMTVIVEEASPTAYMKGAPEAVLDRCDRVLEDGEEQPLTDERREAIVETNRRFASDALRVLGCARRRVEDPDADAEAIEGDMVFLGLQGMIDPPRAEVPTAVADCRSAGIRVVMVTGDNPATATAIGREVGFEAERTLTGTDVEGLSDAELRETVETVDVFARMPPAAKVRVLEALEANDHHVAMTGDGVNDAPALRSADVGIAMGIRGTDVAQQASDMVLQDDNFATIRDAIAEGRGIFDNIRKFVNYLLSANAGEVLVVFVGVILGTLLFPDRFAAHAEALILTPVMLLWINLVTDGLPALALGVDPKADDILDRPPRPADDPIIDRRLMASIATIGVLMTGTGLAVFFVGFGDTGTLLRAQTMLFTFLVTVEVVRIQVIRSRYDLPFTSNRWLLGAIASTLALQLLVLYTPASAFFDVQSLALTHWLPIAAGFVGFLLLNVLAEAALDRA